MEYNLVLKSILNVFKANGYNTGDLIEANEIDSHKNNYACFSLPQIGMKKINRIDYEQTISVFLFVFKVGTKLTDDNFAAYIKEIMIILNSSGFQNVLMSTSVNDFEIKNISMGKIEEMKGMIIFEIQIKGV